MRKTLFQLANRIETLAKMLEANYPGSMAYAGELTFGLNPRHLKSVADDLASVKQAANSGDILTVKSAKDNILRLSLS